MAKKIFHPGDKAIFRPKAKYSVIDDPEPIQYAGEKIKVAGKGREGWDYEIYVRSFKTFRKKIFCNADELVRI